MKKLFFLVLIFFVSCGGSNTKKEVDNVVVYVAGNEENKLELINDNSSSDTALTIHREQKAVVLSNRRSFIVSCYKNDKLLWVEKFTVKKKMIENTVSSVALLPKGAYRIEITLKNDKTFSFKLRVID